MPLMVGNVIRNLFNRPATRRYPAESREPFAGARGRITFIAEKCDFCGDCERACPSQAVVLDTVMDKVGRRKRGFSWVRIYKPYRCIMCNMCVQVCPYAALMVKPDYGPPATEPAAEYDKVESW